MRVLKACWLAVILIAFVILAMLPAVVTATDAEDMSWMYFDPKGDVHDTQLDTMTTQKQVYDILNATLGVGETVVILTLNTDGGLDHDGFYIFQCYIPGGNEYVFSYSKLEYMGRDKSNQNIPVDGVSSASSLTISIQSNRFSKPESLRLQNVSAQSGDLRYIDVMDCNVDITDKKTKNEMLIIVYSHKSIGLKFTTVYEDSTDFKAYMDINNDGYVDLGESQKFALDVETGIELGIKSDTEAYYASTLLVNDKPPWDIKVYVDVIIDQLKVNAKDNSSIIYEFDFDYKGIDPGPFTLSVPINGSFLDTDESDFNLTVRLQNGERIVTGDTDSALRPYIFANGTGLRVSKSDLADLQDRRYDIGVSGDDGGVDVKTYIIIAVISVVVAGIIFFLYANHKFKKDEKEEEDEEAVKNKKPRPSKIKQKDKVEEPEKKGKKKLQKEKKGEK